MEAARLTVACRPTSAHLHLQHPPPHLPHPQMEQIIQLLWVKQGYIHFWGREKGGKEMEGSIWAAVCLLWKPLEGCTSSQHLDRLR